MTSGMRVVLDTDVVVAAVLSERGASRRLLTQVVDGGLLALISVSLMLEYEAVLKRPEHLHAAGLTIGDVEIILDQLAASMTQVDLFFLWRPLLRDGADDMVLETAVNGSADIIVTFNTRDFGDVPGRFGIEVCRPGEFLRRF
jgi:putative PIN family toxin of toxin-antitoxin system